MNPSIQSMMLKAIHDAESQWLKPEKLLLGPEACVNLKAEVTACMNLTPQAMDHYKGPKGSFMVYCGIPLFRMPHPGVACVAKHP